MQEMHTDRAAFVWEKASLYGKTLWEAYGIHSGRILA
mgnify:CR=1 FL=1